MKRFPWLRLMDKKSGPDVPYRPPIWLGPRSNGEAFHPQTEQDRRATRLILEQGAAHARRHGMDRREFMVSSAGMALSLGVLNAVAAGCRSEGVGGGGVGGGGGGADASSAPGADGGAGRDAAQQRELDAQSLHDGGYQPPSVEDCVEQGGEALSGNEFIFDVQTHHFDPDAPWRETNLEYNNFISAISLLFTPGCVRFDRIACFSKERYAEALFVDSDTTMAVLSSWPALECGDGVQTDCGLPLPNESIAATRDWINGLALSQRLLNHCQIMPNLVLEEQLDIMDRVHEDLGVGGWKLYPAWQPPHGSGFWMDDPMGLAVIEKGRSLGVRVFSIHKGLPIPGFDLEHNYPWDIGRVARMFPDCKFIIYHSAICAGQEGLVCSPNEGPYDASSPNASLRGVDTLIRSLQDAGVGPNENVYAELGSCWSNVMNDPVMAQHVIGKLMRYVGEDNVVWGTDSMVAPAPQSQIEAFRSLQISTAFQDAYGYPALTPARRAKIFGLNAAAAYGVDAEAVRCRVSRAQIARREVDAELGGRRWAVQAPGGPRTRREFLSFARWQRVQGRPG
jgi:uncharacterized protein